MSKKMVYRNFNKSIAEQINFLYTQLSDPDLDPRRAQAYMYEFLSLTGQLRSKNTCENIVIVFKAIGVLTLMVSVAYAIYQISTPRPVKTEISFNVSEEEDD